MYLAIREATERQGLRLTYLDGTLKIMPPSELHEESKKLIARLLETWAVERDVDLRAYGSTTWRSEPKKAGAEADEAYRLGPHDPGSMPDIAIEVTVSHEDDDKLEVYARLGIKEVWHWSPETRRVIVRALVGQGYVVQPHSTVLPDLDLQMLASFVREGQNQTQLIKQYRATIAHP
jgi:Uma2 family endonuclease